MLPITLKISKILIILFAYCKNNLLGLVLDMLWLSSFHATFNVHKVMLLQNESKHHQYKSIFKSNQSHWQLVEAIHVFAAAKVWKTDWLDFIMDLYILVLFWERNKAEHKEGRPVTAGYQSQNFPRWLWNIIIYMFSIHTIYNLC